MTGDATDNNSTWTSWGDEQPALPRTAKALLKSALGNLTPQQPVDISRATLAPSALPSAVHNELVEALGAQSVLTDDTSRARRAGGQSYSDLVRRRSGDAGDAPDAVVVPETTGAIADVLRICEAAKIAVVTWGGGTSVVGGLAALRGDCAAVIALDLSRLDRLIGIDAVSQTATFEPGIRAPAAEAALAEHGLTLGHVPQSFERASLGGFVVTRSSGQASSGYGRIDDLLVGARMVTPRGEIVLPTMPGSAAGPDLRRLVLGSEGTLGIVTEVTVRVRPVPAVKRYEGWIARSWDDGVALLRQIAQEGPKPDIVRLSDLEETRISLAMSGTSGAKRRAMAAWLRLHRVRGGAMIILGFEGSARDVQHRRREAHRLLHHHRAVPLGASAGSSWEHHRFSGAYLRDTLLDTGVLAETLETATTWSRLHALHDGITQALTDSLTKDGRPPLVGCHISHLYPTGASLYFTVLANADSGREIEQWAAAKQAANAAIVAGGGTATHHHGVGTAHRPIVAVDLGGEANVGVEALRAMKDYLDPAGILNPGKLLPDGYGGGYEVAESVGDADWLADDDELDGGTIWVTVTVGAGEGDDAVGVGDGVDAVGVGFAAGCFARKSVSSRPEAFWMFVSRADVISPVVASVVASVFSDVMVCRSVLRLVPPAACRTLVRSGPSLPAAFADTPPLPQAAALSACMSDLS